MILPLVAKLLEKIGRRKNRFFRIGGRRDIHRKKGEDYLQRWYLFSSNVFAAYIHRFWNSDYPVMHSHPWSSISIVVHGSYLEHLPDGTTLKRGKGGQRVRFMKPTDMHWVQAEEPGNCWTIFIRFKKVIDWGFLTKNGWVRWDLYDPEIQELRNEQNHNR